VERLDCRDRLVGVDGQPALRTQFLSHAVNQVRFLILPRVKVRHLASAVLAESLEYLQKDWLRHYGAPVWLVESFVDRTLWLRNNPDGTIKYALSNAPESTAMSELVRLSAARWPVERCFQEGKSELGLDHYEHRSWPAWHRHMRLVFLAHLFLLRACPKIARGPAARDFGCGQGGEVRASPTRAVRTEPTQATDKRPAARRVFAPKAAWLRCSSVEDPGRIFSFVAPRHPAFGAKTRPRGIFGHALRVAPNFAWGCVAPRSQPHWRGMLARRALPQAKLGATNVSVFTKRTTKGLCKNKFRFCRR